MSPAAESSSISRVTGPVDDRYFPLVVYALPARLDSEFVDDFTSKVDRLLRRGEPHVVVVDLLRLRELPSPLVRRALGDWVNANRSMVKELALAAAVVVGSPILRGGLTALFWIAPPPHPMEVVATPREAVEFVRPHYEKARGASAAFGRYLREVGVMDA